VSITRLLFLSAIAASVAFLLRLTVVEGVFVATGSMEPTLPTGTHLFLDKMTLRLRDPARGDLIVFKAPVPPHEEMIKRVIGLPGETIEMKEKAVLVGGVRLEEPYAFHSRGEERLKGDTIGRVQIPSGHYFVLGDNRDESNDSTVWKDPGSGDPVRFVPRSSIRGLVRGFY